MAFYADDGISVFLVIFALVKREPLSLYELNHQVRLALNKAMPETYLLQAELSEVRENSAGHCYLEFVQKSPQSGSFIAKARGIIWKSDYLAIKERFQNETNRRFCAGIKVLVSVEISFHEQYGYSLRVKDIDPSYTLGDMARVRREILSALERDGVREMNKEIPLPRLLKYVAVISSYSAAGYGDFCNQLSNNADGFVFATHLFPAQMQGEGVESSIIRALHDIQHSPVKWDAVVIIRGGGAVSDLNGFESYNLAAHCAQFPIPIITGIGHERDETVVDLVAHTRCKTPTAVAEFLLGKARACADGLSVIRDTLRRKSQELLQKESALFQILISRLPHKALSLQRREALCCQEIMSKAKQASVLRIREQQNLRKEVLLLLRKNSDNILSSHHKTIALNEVRIPYLSQRALKQEEQRLSLAKQAIRLADPELLLSRGYTLTLKNNHIITRATQLQSGDKILTRFSDGTIKSVVMSE